MLDRGELLALLRAQRARRDELLDVDAQQWAWHCGAAYALARVSGIDPNGPIPDDEPGPEPPPEVHAPVWLIDPADERPVRACGADTGPQAPVSVQRELVTCQGCQAALDEVEGSTLVPVAEPGRAPEPDTAPVTGSDVRHRAAQAAARREVRVVG